MSKHRTLRSLGTLALLCSLAACGGSEKKAADATGSTAAGGSGTSTSTGAAATATDKVAVKDFKFTPSAITVPKGSTVTWTFSDDQEHSVVSKSGAAQEIQESPALKGGKTFTHTFSTTGTYDYVCGIHNFMTGTVVVTAA